MSTDILVGDVIEQLRTLPSDRVQCAVTSPPYWGLRDYGVDGQIGAEDTPQEYVDRIVQVFREVRRTLRNDGTLWLNLGDSYAANRSYQVDSTKGGPKHSKSQSAGGKGSSVPEGLKPKDLVGIPWRVAFALQADGWWLRQDIIWAKPNPMPESVTDRCTKSHEYIFLLTKSERYYFNHTAIKEPAVRPEGGGNKTHKGLTAYEGGDERMRTKVGLTEIGPRETRNKRDVWSITTQPYKGAHFAVFPEKLVEPCVLAGSKEGDTILDPFCGSGTVGVVAKHYGRDFIGIDLNPEYAALAESRIATGSKKLGELTHAEPYPVGTGSSYFPAPTPTSRPGAAA